MSSTIPTDTARRSARGVLLAAPARQGLPPTMSCIGLVAVTLSRGGPEAAALRRTLHFAHSRAHVAAAPGAAGPACLAMDEAVHEVQGGEARPGLGVGLRGNWEFTPKGRRARLARLPAPS